MARAGRGPRSVRPTVVVGGLSLGGAGRTPVVEWLALRAHARGLRVAVVGHGYRGRSRGRVDSVDGGAYGDEAAALRRRLPAGVEIHVGPRGRLVPALDADLVLVDGGFFDPRCPRTLDLLVLDATAADGVVPAGPLRAPLTVAGRADFVWLHRWNEPGARAHPTDVRSAVRAAYVELPDGREVPPEWLRGRPVEPVVAIGRPDSFRNTLSESGAVLGRGLERADHHRFSARELASVGSGLRITTTKDRERLPPGYAAVLHTTLEVEGAEALVGAVGWV